MKCCGHDVIVRGRLLRVAHLDVDKYDSIEPSEALLDALRQADRRIDVFTFMQIAPDTAPKYSYLMEVDNLAILPVSTFEHWWNCQIRSYPRNRARQAEKKGVTIREVEFDDLLARGIWEIYNETKVRQGRRNFHYGKDLATIRRESATFLDRSVFIGAYFEGNLIGFVKLMINLARTQAGIMSIAAMVLHRDKATTNALIAHCVRACADRNIPYLMYQNMIYGNKDADSMAHFKRINGFEQIDLPRYYMPLTPLGGFALKHGLHHKLIDQLPKALAARLRQVRRAWYNRKLPSETGAF